MESNTTKVLLVESTVDAFTAITNTAIPHTSASLTVPLMAEHPEKSTVPYTLTSLTANNPEKSNSLHEIDSLHENTTVARGGTG